MHLSLAEYISLDSSSLRAFVQRCIPEGPQLDYKSTIGPLPITGDVKSEFMKDVTAFANAEGGILVFGYDEPNEETGIPGNFHGVQDGQEIAAVLERVAHDRADPRIPQFMIKAVHIDANLYAIVCYIRASELKPHMCGGKFYMRHSESSSPMDALEVKQTVLSAYSRKAEITELLISKEDELIQYRLGETPGFILQAIPLISLTNHWDVNSEPFLNIVRGHDRYRVHQEYSLNCNAAPFPGIRSIRGNENRNNDSKWYLEISSAGHLAVVYRNFLKNDQNVPYLHSDNIYLFRAFGHLVDEALSAGQATDSRFIISAKYLNGSDTVFYRRFVNPMRAHGPLSSDSIDFPNIEVDYAQEAKDVTMEYAEMLFHAFGINPATNELPQIGE